MLHLIYARSRNNVIGRDGKLPWDLPEDLAHFKKTTLGAPVIMGRKTWESLPENMRPLPGRRNIVISRSAGFGAPGAEVAHSLLQASQMVPLGRPAWVIGGARLLEDALAVATLAVVTEIELDCEGDAFAPILDVRWGEAARENHVSRTGLRYSIVRYERKVPLHKEPPRQAPPFADRGPWRAGATQTEYPQRVFVESEDFTHDVRLYVDGDFGDLRARMEYARGLAATLNKAAAQG